MSLAIQSKKSLLLSAFALFSLLLFRFSAFAQTDPPIRIELESAKDQQDYKFVPLNRHGVAVFYQSAVLSIDTAQWIFIHYDTNLVKTGIYKLKLPNLCQYLAADFSNNKLYLFLQKPAFKKDTLRNFLLEWDLMTQDFQLFDLQNYKFPYLSSIKVADDYLFIVVDEQKAKSIIYYNYKTHAKQAIQFTEDEITSIESFCVDPVVKKTYFCMFLKNKKGSRAELFTTDYSGNIKERVAFPFYADMQYNSARIALTGKDSLLIVGGYSYAKDRKQKGCYSGIYTMKFAKNKLSDLNTHSFGALLAKDSELNTKHLEESNLTMSAHVMQSNGHIFAITELFYPEYQYRSPASSYRGFGHYGYDQPTRTFSGFRFLNAYILEFNVQGLLLNEWFFPVNNVLTQSFYNLVKLHQDEEGNTLFYYVHNNEIVSQFMDGQRIIGAQATIPVDLTYKTDLLEYSSNVSMRHWYGNNFLLSGYQYIKSTQRGKGKRYVFFLNKLICE
ncbi:MAG: hypothetical protein FWC34_08425 [Bacteroidetes bacterium]|nr:hypothetical protein [Bacteroidota bacterium]MCL2302427.1 hypothetical protein [Lentimicrobiaceae bacterium]